MERSQYRRLTGEFLRGKKGKMNKTIRNNSGQTIHAGEQITFSGKSGRGGFNISNDSGVFISQVSWRDIDFDSETKKQQ